MTTGKLHQRLVAVSVSTDFDDEKEQRSTVPCRCMIGVDHDAAEVTISQYDPDEDEQDGEALSVYEAADIWRSNGEDPDYAFGYGEDELRQAAED